MNTSREVFSCNSRPATSVAEADESEALVLEHQEKCLDEPVCGVVGSRLVLASPLANGLAIYAIPQQPTAKIAAAASDQ